MISHFQWKPLFKSSQIPGWSFSFYFQGTQYNGVYNKDGSIDWHGNHPDLKVINNITKQIHELMLYHVYE
ncbi:YheE family protein [Bacillus sp. JJ1521]|uniref:YheE family protein n=1 Tax=Bacillus sp. JJ1521 TaxID=3122957 RepID=UPI002FFDC05E